jgi:hypothetical protein
MVLYIPSDAYYLSVSNAWSRLGGLFFLGNKYPEQDALNGSILNVVAVIKNVVASKAESEVGACFHNAQSGADKLLPLPLPPVRARTDARTKPSAKRSTQLRRVLACVYAVLIQNQITTNVP